MSAEYYVVDKKTGEPVKVQVDWAGWEDRRYLASSDAWKGTVFGWHEIARGNNKLRVLTETQTGRILGAYAFSLDINSRLLYIDCIESVAKNEIRYIGTILMMDAVEQSIKHGFEGRVRLVSRWEKEEDSAPEIFFSKIGMIKEDGKIHCLDADVNITFWNFSFDEASALEFLNRWKKQ